MEAFTEQDFDLKLTSGRVRGRRIGSPMAPLVILVHGLSAHLHSFDDIVERLASPDRQLVALDLRGRGRSEITAAGSYGLAAHCHDILDAATQLGADRFDLVGWSMGALIGICVANRAPERLRRLALMDAAGGDIDPGAADKVAKGLARLEMVVKEPSDYVQGLKNAGGISPWTPFWDRFYEYELGPYGRAWKPTTSRAACVEDFNGIAGIDWPALWKGIAMPALLVRCLVPIGGGFVVSESARDAMQRAVLGLKIIEVRTDHYTVVNSRVAADAIREFLDLE